MARKKDSRILLVDDDKELAESLAEHLSNTGCLVKVAYDGREGLKMFRAGAFHVVLTDLKMPGMDGMQLLHEIKRLEDKAVVVMITGYGSIESAVEAIRKGAYDYITKPLKLAEIEVVINRALEKRRLIKQLDVFKGLTLAVLISIPIWLILGIILASIIF
jgi:DNA-binding NtrC family response regulator